MKEQVTCNVIMDILSDSGIGAALVSDAGMVLELNAAGCRLLDLDEDPSGQLAPDALRDLMLDAGRERYVLAPDGGCLKCHPVPRPADLPEGALFVGFRDARADYRADIMGVILNKITEGVVACNNREELIYINDAAATVDSIVGEDAIGKRVDAFYTMTDGSEVVLPRVMKQQSPFLNYRQRYTTQDGKKADVIANAYPIIVQGQVLGAFNVVEDWSKVDQLHKKIIDLQEKLVKYSEKTEQKKSALTARYTFDDILYQSQAMRMVVEQCRQVARTDSSVMIYGETGTGKELFAQSIHNASNRANGPFLAINCAALPENLLESLLFGSVKGAYTGAENRKGLFEQANHGTLLLDEINSMNITLQAKLLRVLQEGTVRKVGGSEEIPVDVRVLSNINVPPYEAIANQHLRQDLFYRLGVVNINIPPLRERIEDLPKMIDFFIAENNRKFGRTVQGIDRETLGIFEAYQWPGNVRELQHAVEHAMIILPDHAVDISKEYIPHHLLATEEMIQTGRPAETAGAPKNGENLNKRLQNLEEKSIRRALEEHRGNITRAAKSLDISRQNLQYRIRRYGIAPEEYRS